MSGPSHRPGRNAAAYLLIAGVVLAAAMGPRLLGEVDRQSLIADVDPDFQRIDAAIDAYWKHGFAEQYPDARSRYERPSLRYYQPSVEPDRGGFVRDALAYYDRDEGALRINLDKLPEITPFVLAHEYGHHLQHLTGVNQRFGALTLLAQPGDGAQRDRISVRVELQAECLAGVWAHHAEGVSEGIDEATIRREIAKLSMSAPIDTHGTGRQRAEWFYRGYAQGRAADCDTVNLAWEDL